MNIISGRLARLGLTAIDFGAVLSDGFAGVLSHASDCFGYRLTG